MIVVKATSEVGDDAPEVSSVDMLQKGGLEGKGVFFTATRPA